jgi:hypothetical protein
LDSSSVARFERARTLLVDRKVARLHVGSLAMAGIDRAEFAGQVFPTP